MSTEANLIHQLNAITSVEDQEQLNTLESVIESIEKGPIGAGTSAALLRLFERFPESDGYGIFWSIVHLLEANGGYEPLLVESVENHPSEFGVMMVNRLINGGVQEVNGSPLIELLQAVSANGNAPPEVRESAEEFLDFQRSGGLNA